MKYTTNTYNKITKASALLLAVLVSGSVAMAQPIGVQFGGQFMFGSPQGDFQENINTNGYGGSAFASYTLPNTPVQLGIELGGMIYGHELRNEPFSTTIPDVFVDVETQNLFMTGHSFLRFQLPNGMVRPYVDGLIGFNHLYTETSIRDEDWGDNDGSSFSSTHSRDTGLSYGVGGGAMVGLFSTITEDGYPLGISLDLRVRMLNGASVDYLKKGSIRRVDGQVEYDTQRSKTDTVFFQAGIVFSF